MFLGKWVSGVVAFLRAGYPATASPLGHAPLLALLPRRVSDEELESIVAELHAAQRAAARPELVDQTGPADRTDRGDLHDRADIAVAITGVTDEMPSLRDIQRVRDRLAGAPEPP
jgi:DNA segregation ATPase FtsK/SpoIIIE-like protein